VAAALLVAGCGTGGSAEAAQRPDIQNGETLFKSTCAACHTLAAAGTNGTLGPNLDNAFAADVKQGFLQSAVENVVLDQIRLGSGPVATYTTTKDFIKRNCLNQQKKCLSTSMPADLVKGQDAIDVAAYVASVAGQGGFTEPGGFAALGNDGLKIFNGAGCAGCHTLAAAGSTGTTGPNLDQLKPAYPIIVRQVTTPPPGLMPAFKGRLTPAQIQAVAQYVASHAGK
jgi:mono/diheme cytochrome c family protein